MWTYIPVTTDTAGLPRTALPDQHSLTVRTSPTGITISVLALISVYIFAYWWFTFDHIPRNFSRFAHAVDVFLFVAVSYIIWHPIVMEILTWSISSFITAIPKRPPLPGLKVAFITTIVPDSESLSLLHRCLPAMVQASYPHDTWILDERDSEEVKGICSLYGVNHFSRYGKTYYNTPEGKFAVKTKGGNHNSWYDVYGDQYDFVAQIDTDFVPEPTFLTKTLGYFRDERVAFVGTPQIYGNTESSFIAKGAAEQMYSFYGSVLRGLSGMDTTLLIGANHVIRVAALRDVDHYSAHITEDLLTGMKLHTKGWKSVYLPLPLAIGEGPTTWEAYFNQQTRWAYGCMDILFHQSRSLYKKMGVRRGLYYFFLQQYYFSGLAMAISVCLVGLYFGAGILSADVELAQFLTVYGTTLFICWLMSVWLQRYDIGANKKSPFLIVGKIISIAAWPIYFLAFISVLRGKRITYKVTPKGDTGLPPSSNPYIFLPHLMFGGIALLGIVSSTYTHRQNSTMLFWAYCSLLLMFFVPYSQGVVQDLSMIAGEIREFVRAVKTIFYQPRQIMDTTAPLSLSPSLSVRFPEIIRDCIFLTVVGIASFLLYLPKLGFYSDDWSFLGNFVVSSDQSLIGLFLTATTANTMMRPVQNFYDALLYWLFGLQPLGYQIVNASVILLIAVLFYLVLRQIRIPRIMAITIPLLYMLLPQYATDRFWFAAFQANLSVLFYFVSLSTGILACLHPIQRKTIWMLISIVSMTLSILSYEVIVPLFLVHLVLYWYVGNRQRYITQQRSVVWFIFWTLTTLAAMLLFKAETTTRLGTSPMQNLFAYPGYVRDIIVTAIQVQYGVWGLYLFQAVWILLKKTSLVILMTAISIGIGICYYLYSVLATDRADLPSLPWIRKLTVISFGLFILGYAIFFVNNNVGFSSTGIANRVAIAAAIGVACTMVGVMSWLSKALFSRRWGHLFFSVVISLLCACCFLILNTLALFWMNAYEQGQIVLSRIHSQFPYLPQGSTLILDGVCPYVGPATVFESQWDVKGALQTLYHDPTIQADIVTPRLQVTDAGLQTRIYQFVSLYPYGNLYVYNFPDSSIHPLPDEESARTYFHTHNPDYTSGCPVGTEGNGIEVL